MKHKVLIKNFLQKALYENIYNYALIRMTCMSLHWREKIPPTCIVVFVINSHTQRWIVQVIDSPTCRRRSGVQSLNENTFT